MDHKKIKDTLFLPRTNLSLKNTNHREIEERIQKFGENERIYQKSLSINFSKPPFILHSGPAYANGKIHLGHVLNYTIKDIIVRFQATRGFYTPFLIGGDTHGLPIEHKVLQLAENSRKNLRVACQEFALQQVQLQKEQLKKLGLFTDYEKYYITLSKSYEAEQIRVFGELAKKGLIYRDGKPVYWSFSHETALAENEIEYLEKKDISLYFKLNLVENPEFLDQQPQQPIKILIGTTQPWTIPANQLVAVKKTAFYALVLYDDEYLIILEKQIHLLEKGKKKDLHVKKIFQGEKLLNLTYFHPYQTGVTGRIVDGEDFVQEKEGTGIVHLAPAFGAEDFAIAKKENLIIDCPLDSQGKFDEKIAFSLLIGKHYQEASQIVVADLSQRGLVAQQLVITHSYPHDGRDKSPLIYRLTEQGFIRVESIKKELLNGIEKVKGYPAGAKEKIQQTISAREDWCISRQRKGGVPIPVLFQDKKPLLIPEVIDYIAEIFSEKGSGCGFDGTILTFLQAKFPQLINETTQLGEDIMDVGFDSGISHGCVLLKEKF